MPRTQKVTDADRHELNNRLGVIHAPIITDNAYVGCVISKLARTEGQKRIEETLPTILDDILGRGSVISEVRTAFLTRAI